MNATQRQSILDAIVEFEKADFETPFKNKYKDVETFDSIVIADFSIAQLYAISKRAIAQLKELLENGNWQIIPSDNIQMPLYGSITLRNANCKYNQLFAFSIIRSSCDTNQVTCIFRNDVRFLGAT